MPDKKEPPSGSKTGGGEADLWASAMQDVRPLKGANKKLTSEPQKTGIMRERVDVVRIKKEVRAGKGLDSRTDERLRKGKMEIEARIDLHGFTRAQAQGLLQRELLKFHAQGKRCILVITGKGGRRSAHETDWWEEKPGTLRRELGGWLAQKPLDEVVLQIHPAKQHDGGEGAFYVLLRRKR